MHINSMNRNNNVDEATKYGQCAILLGLYTEPNTSLKWYFGTFCVQYVNSTAYELILESS